jgi:hypothetical protein
MQPTYILDSIAAPAKLIGQQKLNSSECLIKLALPDKTQPSVGQTILNMLDPVIRRYKIKAIQTSVVTASKKHYKTWFLLCEITEEIQPDASRLDRMRRRLAKH